MDKALTQEHIGDEEFLAVAERSSVLSKEMFISIDERGVTYSQEGRTWGQG